MSNIQTQTPTLPPECLPTLLRAIPEGILYLNEEGTVESCNPAAEALLGVSGSKILLNNFWNHFPDPYFGFSMREALKGKTLQKNYNFHSEQKLALKAIPFSQEKGLLILIQDQTELTELRLAANRSTRLKELGGMAALLAHEIRNPLGGIKGFAALLSRDLKESPELRHMADFIIQGTENLSQLTTHVLNYAHPFQTHLEETPLNDLIQDLLANLRADENVSKDIHFELLAASKIQLPVDKQLIRSALLNLMMNAIQAMPDGGTLKILLHAEDEQAVIRVCDTGTGIAPENLKKLFSAFFTTKPQGNGFGLLEVHKVMQAHHGKIDVESVLGQGTTFTIKLPLT